MNIDYETSFKFSVLDHAEKAYQTIYRSLEDHDRAIDLLMRACREWERFNEDNLKRATKQSNHYLHPGTTVDSANANRKKAVTRIYPQIGADAFQTLVKEHLAIAETQCVDEGITPSPQSSHFRYLKKLFDSQSFSKGAFGPIAGVFGVLLGEPTRLVSQVSAIMHGICHIRDTNARNFRNENYFGHEINNRLAELFDHFSPLGVFEENHNEDLPTKFDTVLKGHRNWFKVRPLTRNEESNIAPALKLLAPWGERPIATDALSRNLRLHQLPDFFNPGQTPLNEIPYVRRRIASVMDLGFIRQLLNNDSIRINEMSDQIFLPILRTPNGGEAMSCEPMPELPMAVKFQIAEDQLSFTAVRHQLTDFSISVEVDHRIVHAGSDPQTQDFGLTIPPDTKVVTVYATVMLNKDDSVNIPIATILPQLRDWSIEPDWVSDNVFDCGQTLSIKIAPTVNHQGIYIQGRFHDSNEKLVVVPEKAAKKNRLFDSGIRPNDVERELFFDKVFFACFVALSFVGSIAVTWQISGSVSEAGAKFLVAAIYLPLLMGVGVSFYLRSRKKIRQPYLRRSGSGFRWQVFAVLLVALLVPLIVAAKFRVAKIETALASESERAAKLAESAISLEKRTLTLNQAALDRTNSGGPDEIDQPSGEDADTDNRILEIQKTADPSFLPTMWAHLGKVNNEFGFRRNPFGGRTYEFHPGMDIDGERGDIVVSPATGTVITAGYAGGYGNMIEIYHCNGLTTRYGHLSKIEVEIGETVARGQLIGYIGSTGRSAGPHLHYELRLNDRPINPRHLLPREPVQLSEMKTE